MNLSIQSIERIVLLGGGKLLLSLVNWSKSEGTPISVVTSPRHAQEISEDGDTLTEKLVSMTLGIYRGMKV